MNPVPAVINAPASPQVNLLPPEVAARRSQGRAKVLIAVIFAIFLGGIAVAYFLVLGLRTVAESDLADAEARRTELQTELASYGYINDLAATYDNSVAARAWAGSTDIDWATHLRALLGAVPEGITFTDVVIAQGTPIAPASGDGTAFAQADMGSLTFTGRSSDPSLTADLIEAIDALPGFSGTFVEAKAIASNEDTNTVYWEYSGSTRITYTALSYRTETEQTDVPAEVLDAVPGAAPDASPSPSPSATAEGGN